MVEEIDEIIHKENILPKKSFNFTWQIIFLGINAK
jgi:hypothetical protein